MTTFQPQTDRGMTAAPVVNDAEPAASISQQPSLRVVIVNGSPSGGFQDDGARRRHRRHTVRDPAGRNLPHRRLLPGNTVHLHDRPRTGRCRPELEATLRLAEEADLLIAAAPVFRGSYPGLFKHFFDLVDQYALANKPVLLAATGGGEHHALVLEHALRPLFGFFQAHTVPVAIFAAAGDFDGTLLLNPRVYGRIQTGLDDVSEYLKARATGTPADFRINEAPEHTE